MGFLSDLFGKKTPTSADLEAQLNAKRDELARLQATTSAADDAAWAQRRALADAVARLEAVLDETRAREAAEAKAAREKRLAELRAARDEFVAELQALAPRYVELDREFAKLNAERDALAAAYHAKHHELESLEIEMGLRTHDAHSPSLANETAAQVISESIGNAQRAEKRLDFNAYKQLRPLI